MAEAHPVGFRHPMIAKEKGARLIHVDPRFTRTSAMCDIYAPLRPGTDIAFLGGLINYVMPFVQGESLRQRLERENRLPVQETIRLVLEVCDALR